MKISPERIVQWGEPLFRLFGFRRPSGSNGLKEIKRVLIVRPDEIGDAVMTTAFLRELRLNMPDAFVMLVMRPEVVDLFTRCPYVNQVIPYRWDVYGRFPKAHRLLEILRLCVTQLWKKRFDLAIYPRWDIDYYDASLLVYLSGASRRVAFSENVASWKKKSNAGYDHFFTQVMDDGVLKHVVKHNLDVISFLGGRVRSDKLELWLTPEDEQWAEETLRSSRKPGPYVALVMGGRQMIKRWPFESFGELAALLNHAYGATMVLLGSREDQEIGILRGPIIDLRGKASLPQSVAVLKQCALYVGNDTGPVHIAAAVGTPIVELCCHPQTGSTLAWPWPHRYHPWSDAYKVIRPGKARPPCTDGCVSETAHCILDVPVSAVFEAARGFLSRSQKKALITHRKTG